MFVDENNEGQEPQNPGLSGSNVMDQSINLGSEDDDYQSLYIPDEGSYQNIPAQPAQPAAPAAPAAPANGDTAAAAAAQAASNGAAADDNQIKFSDDEDAPAAAAASGDDDEALIKKLQEKGFKIEREATNDPNTERQQQISILNSSINRANEFIAKDDKFVVTEKLRSDLAAKYKQTGRDQSIGNEEFELELEAEYSYYEDNPQVKKIFADNIRSSIKSETIDKKADQLKNIVATIEQERETESRKNREGLKNSLKGFANQKFFDIPVTPELVSKAYDNVISGNFAEAVKKNPDMLARMSLLHLLDDQLGSDKANGTYGEGVKDAMRAFQGDDKNKSRSPLAQGMQATASSSDTGRINRNWSSVVEENELPEKAPATKHVAGAMDF